jgi:3-methyladenine DNA glycosylase/8-oxoguanine DNA glycosylase
MSPPDRPLPAPGLDLVGSWRPLRLSRLDPTVRLAPGAVAWAAWTPDGPGALRLVARPGQVLASAYGPGAGFLLDHAGPAIGDGDDPTGFEAPPALAEAARAHAGVRLLRLPVASPGLWKFIVQQLVTFADAARGWQLLVRRHGEPAPGPDGLWLPPRAEALARLPDYAMVPLGILGKQARALREAAALAHQVEKVPGLAHADAEALLLKISGVGPWTAANTLGTFHGHADAVPTGDVHLPNTVAWALTGAPRADDARMLELLEPHRPHRHRVLRLLFALGAAAPRAAPRREPRPLPRP